MDRVARPGTEWHVATDHLLANLRRRTISGAVVTVGAQAVKFVLVLGSTVVLTRLLPPHDFGLVAIALTVTGLLRNVKEVGLSSATVQSPDLTQAQVSNLFWINLVLGGALGLVVLLSAPAVSWIFREPQLTSLTVALAFTFPLEGAAVQHVGLLRRQMQFADLALIEVGSMVIAIVVGIAMAWRGAGMWALVGSQLSLSAATFGLTWWRSRWRPSRPARHRGTRPLVRFGANLAAGNLIFSIGRGADNILIGRWHGPHAVGLYSRAEALLSRPLELMLAPVSAVVVPALSRLHADPARYRRTFLQVFEALALASFLCTGLGLALAQPIVLVLLGPKWEGAVVVFAALVLTAVFRPLSQSCSWLFESRGRGGDSLVAGSFISVLAVAAFVIGLPYGPAGAAIAYSVAGLLVQLPFMFALAGRSGEVGASDLWSAVLRQLPVWGVVGGATALARHLVGDAGPLAQLALCGPLGLLAGLGFLRLYPPSYRTATTVVRAWREFRQDRGEPGR